MTSNGPAIVDWISAMQASPLVDVARQHLTLSVFSLPDGYAQKSRVAGEAFIRAYAGLTGTTVEALRAAIEPYIAVMAAMRMNESACDAAEQAMLVDFVRAR